jgi:hypothetical protein
MLALYLKRHFGINRQVLVVISTEGGVPWRILAYLALRQREILLLAWKTSQSLALPSCAFGASLRNDKDFLGYLCKMSYIGSLISVEQDPRHRLA